MKLILAQPSWASCVTMLSNPYPNSDLRPVLHEAIAHHPVEPAQPLYLQLAQRLELLLQTGTLRAGQRLPSVRDTAVQNGLSISTALQAYRHLEERGWVQARARAGYFVQPKRAGLRPEPAQPPCVAKTLDDASQELQVAFNFGGYCPAGGDFYDAERIRIALSRAVRSTRHSLQQYDNGPGSEGLRRAMARRALHLGCALRWQDITISASCIQSVALCLMACTQPGDVVAVESPTYFGFLDLLELLHRKPLPIATDARSGISLDALQLALHTQPVRAVLCVPTLSNPLGTVMPLARKKALVELVRTHGIALIEDLVFNDLLASDDRRRAAKAFDTDGSVLACGSFSKTLGPGLRLGWVEAGRWGGRVQQLKSEMGSPTSPVMEHALASLLDQSSYESQLRRLHAQLRDRLRVARQRILASFPNGTRVSAPTSGGTLWVELPHGLDSRALLVACLREGILFVPGSLFCRTARFDHCLRLSFTKSWGVQETVALERIGALARQLAPGAPADSAALVERVRTSILRGRG